MVESALSVQVGGDHYKRWQVQPVQFSEVNELSSCQHSIIKYAMRYDTKDGVRDLRKAMHFCDLMTELHLLHDLDWQRRCVSGRKAAGLPAVDVATFIEVNQLPPAVAAIITLVCECPDPDRLAAAKVRLGELLQSVGGTL
jgi:hypothetical protein